MKVAALILLNITLVCFGNLLLAQIGVEVSKPELSLKNNEIEIAYNLINSSNSDNFTIRIEITDARGRLITANSLSGDIGEGVSGGQNKRIYWDIVADSIFLDEEIFVQIYALPENLSVMETDPRNQEADTFVIDTGKKTNGESAVEKSFTRTSVIFQSLAFPGLGLSRINPGQPHWIKGILGYGCIGGAIYLNRQAIINFDAYQDPANVDHLDDLFNKAEQQDRISEVLGFAAIGIWMTDLIWTIVGTSPVNQPLSSNNLKGLSIGTRIEPMSNVTLIDLRYRF